MGIVFPTETTMLRRASAKKNFEETSGWILESNGRFREFTPTGKRRGWAGPISFFIQLVQSEFEFSDARSVTAGELTARLSNIKDDFGEAPQAAELRRYLQQYPVEEVITEKILKDWPL